MRRVACVALSEIRIEIARDDRPSTKALAIVVARPGGTVKTERDVLGGTRLDVVSREARSLGVRAGQTVAAARAKCSELCVRVVAEEAVQSALVRVAEAALAFGPAVAFDVVQDVVWVEIGGCAHLRGGEHALAHALEARIRALGHACRVAIGDGPRIAAAVARYAPGRRARPAPERAKIPANDREKRRESESLVVPEGEGASAMRILPIAALGLDDDVGGWLVDLGFHTCGDLQKIPRRALGTRLGARTHDVMQLLSGEDRAPLDVWRPPQVPEERIDLEWGASSLEALAFVTKTLCDRLAMRLEGRAMAAARLELVFALDRALCGDEHPQSTIDIVLPSPIARASDLLAVVRTRLERESLAAPVLSATLRAPELASAESNPLDLFAPEPKAHRALPRLVAELAADLGAASVGTLELIDTWIPDERSRLVPFGASRGLGYVGRHALVTSGLEPSRLVSPIRISRKSLVDVELLAHVEAVEWWRREVGRRTIAAAWMPVDPPGTSARTSASALAWVDLTPMGLPHEGHGHPPMHEEEAQLRGWID
jgi:protein ImuB